MADVLEKKEEAKDLLVDKQPKEPLFSKKNRKHACHLPGGCRQSTRRFPARQLLLLASRSAPDSDFVFLIGTLNQVYSVPVYSTVSSVHARGLACE